MPEGAVTGDSLNTKLDKLTTLLSSIDVDEAGRRQITVDLQAFLSQLNDTQGPPDHAIIADKIQSASDDELFEFFDKGRDPSESRHRDTLDHSNERGSS